MFGFEILEKDVIRAINEPDKVDERGKQRLYTKIFDTEYALRIVCEERKGIMVMITFYPVRRDKYGL